MAAALAHGIGAVRIEEPEFVPVIRLIAHAELRRYSRYFRSDHVVVRQEVQLVAIVRDHAISAHGHAENTSTGNAAFVREHAIAQVVYDARATSVGEHVSATAHAITRRVEHTQPVAAIRHAALFHSGREVAIA